VTVVAPELDTLATAALDFANALRIRRNEGTVKALAPGVPVSCAGCPIAATAGSATPHDSFGFVNGWLVAGEAKLYGPRGGQRDLVPVPPVVQDFMCAFDAGMFPDLIAGQS